MVSCPVAEQYRSQIPTLTLSIRMAWKQPRRQWWSILFIRIHRFRATEILIMRSKASKPWVWSFMKLNISLPLIKPQWNVVYKQPNCGPHGRSKYKGTSMSPIRNQHNRSQSHLIKGVNQPTSLVAKDNHTQWRCSGIQEHTTDSAPGQIKKPPF